MGAGERHTPLYLSIHTVPAAGAASPRRSGDSCWFALQQESVKCVMAVAVRGFPSPLPCLPSSQAAASTPMITHQIHSKHQINGSIYRSIPCVHNTAAYTWTSSTRCPGFPAAQHTHPEPGLVEFIASEFCVDRLPPTGPGRLRQRNVSTCVSTEITATSSSTR